MAADNPQFLNKPIEKLTPDFIEEFARFIFLYQQTPADSPQSIWMKEKIEEICARIDNLASDDDERSSIEKFIDETIAQLQKQRDAPDTAIDEEEARRREEEFLKQFSGDQADAKALDEVAAEATTFDFALEAFRNNTPIAHLRQMTKDKSLDFESDDESAVKKYMFACFSELSYLKQTKFDLPSRSRYKVVPSETLDMMQNYDFELDMEKIVNQNLEMATATIDPGRGFTYAVFRGPYFVVIAVRGTSSAKDWLINLNAKPSRFNKTGYHTGFYEEASLVVSDLREAVKDFKLPIYFTGHSLGAAVATLLTHVWGTPHAGSKVMIPYVYATPRIGDKRVADLHKVYSTIRPDDLVPRLAPMSMGYVDVDDQKTTVPDSPLVSEAKIWTKFWMILKNHAIEKYRYELGKAKGIASDNFDPDAYLDALRSRMIDRYRTLGNITPID